MSDGSLPTKVIESSNQVKPRFVNLTRPGKLDVEFAFECIKSLSPWFNDSKLCVASEKGIIEETFAGVCLAVPKDEAATEMTLGIVSDLGVKAVRVDFSESNEKEALIPLLEGLQLSGVSVLLHLVQPLAQAKQMPNSEANEAWKCFVTDTLASFAGMIEAVEIGTTVNRAKWAGYTLDGFISAWETAYSLVKASGLPLIGPNVTDFEPQYNAGILGMLKDRQCLPDIHSNNMFAERAIEPEALDRKILGERFKHFHGYDLIKKLRLIASIARRNGVSRNWSTCAFWTLPRIQRILVSSEEQMADYLTRYFVLCASEGSFERFYWGPLVSRREGLLDDGTGLPEDRTIRDVVAYYRELPGVPERWRRRPAFDAFKTIQSRLSGGRYLRRLCGKKGLEVHAFKKDDQHFHVVWTKNGGLARSKQVYAQVDLEAIESIQSRDGKVLTELPDYFSESPVYLSWRRSEPVELAAGAALMSQTVAARAEEGCDYYSYRTDAWSGMVTARSRADADKLIEALKPDVITSVSSETSLRNARNAIWTVDDPLSEGNLLVVKKPARIAWHKRILDRKKPSKSLRSWNGTSELQRRGIETPKVVAYFEPKDSKKVLDNWFICEHANTRYSARGFFSAYARGEETVEGFTFEVFSEQLIKFIRTMHWRGVYFRDLSGGNVLVRIEDNNRLVFSLIDTARARFSNQKFSRNKRIADLKRLVHKLDPQRQESFMEAYLKKENAHFSCFHKLSFKLYALKASLKRMKRKARKKFYSK
jgi:tRNA A-37 threonylcarbamoyl transferase component Bud32